MIPFIFVIISHVIKIDPMNEWLMKDMIHDTFYLFYSEKCMFSQRAIIEFEKTSYYFNDVLFIEVNCDTQYKICKESGIISFPTLVFKPITNKTSPITFSEARKQDEMINFIVSVTRKSPSHTSKQIVDINELNIDNFTNQKGCNILLYHLPWFYLSKLVLKKLRDLIPIFETEKNVSFGVIDCNLFSKLCYDSSIGNLLPCLGFFTLNNITFKPIPDFPKSETLLENINDRCMTHRKLDGLYNYNYGINTTIKESIINFTVSNNKRMFIEKNMMNQFLTSEFNRIVKFGNSIIKKDLISLRKMLKNSFSSRKSRDSMSIRYNILLFFEKVMMSNNMANESQKH